MKSKLGLHADFREDVHLTRVPRYIGTEKALHISNVAESIKNKKCLRPFLDNGEIVVDIKGDWTRILLPKRWTREATPLQKRVLASIMNKNTYGEYSWTYFKTHNYYAIGKNMKRYGINGFSTRSDARWI